MTKKTYKIFNSYDNRESEAAKKVLKSGILSKFLGQYDKDFRPNAKFSQFKGIVIAPPQQQTGKKQQNNAPTSAGAKTQDAEIDTQLKQQHQLK